MYSATAITPRGRVKAEWPGGPYVSLTFGKLPRPTEVINVWDDEEGKPYIRPGENSLVAVLAAWITEQDEENPGWFDDYIENGRWDA